MCKLVAVYGTLRRGGPANHYLVGAKYIGQDKIPGKLYKVGWFPGVKLDPEFATVVDVYEIPNDDAFMRKMDRYECYVPHDPNQSLFVRRKTLLNERNEEAFVYEYCYEMNEMNRIESGDWFNKEGQDNDE